MLKHVGKHNDRKIVVLYRQVPNEDHMCLLVYSDLLPRLVHDEIMKVLESPSGQAAKDLADALFRNMMADGRNTLEVLHREKYIKKVPTNQVIITPTTKSNVRLDELNSILNEMEQGEEAVRRMAELDANLGVGSGKRRQPADRELGVPPQSRSQPAEVVDAPVMSDQSLVEQRLVQAEKMKASAAQLLAEAERLIAEASTFTNAPTKPKRNVKKKSVKAD